MSWTIRPAAPSDARAVAEVGARLFREAYGATHPEPALTPYLATCFALPAVEGLLADRDATLLVAQSPDRAAFVGYAHLRMSAPEAPSTVLTRALPGRRPMEIVRFYVAAEFHGRGLAAALMAACDAEARARDADVLWLQAWQQAARALAYYARAGFERIGTAIFAFGQREDHDFVLARPVAPAPSMARAARPIPPMTPTTPPPLASEIAPPHDGDRCRVVAGTHAGKSGVVRDVHTSKGGNVTITVVQDDGARFKTLARNVVVRRLPG